MARVVVAQRLHEFVQALVQTHRHGHLLFERGAPIASPDSGLCNYALPIGHRRGPRAQAAWVDDSQVHPVQTLRKRGSGPVILEQPILQASIAVQHPEVDHPPLGSVQMTWTFAKPLHQAAGFKGQPELALLVVAQDHAPIQLGALGHEPTTRTATWKLRGPALLGVTDFELLAHRHPAARNGHPSLLTTLLRLAAGSRIHYESCDTQVGNTHNLERA